MSELTDFFRHVEAQFRIEDPHISICFGRREVAKQINQGTRRAGRIVFHEGAPDGDAWREEPVRWVGSAPQRPLVDLLERFTVDVWGFDPTRAEDAAAQHDATLGLFRAFRRILFHKAEGRCRIESSRWKAPQRNERKFGMEVELVCNIRTQVLDYPVEVLEGLASTTTLTALGETETVVTEGNSL